MSSEHLAEQHQLPSPAAQNPTEQNHQNSRTRTTTRRNPPRLLRESRYCDCSHEDSHRMLEEFHRQRYRPNPMHQSHVYTSTLTTTDFHDRPEQSSPPSALTLMASSHTSSLEVTHHPVGYGTTQITRTEVYSHVVTTSSQENFHTVVQEEPSAPAENPPRTLRYSSNESDECPICLEDSATPSAATSCGHSFCAACISKWLGRKNTCPVCRTVLSSWDVQRLRIGVVEDRGRGIWNSARDLAYGLTIFTEREWSVHGIEAAYLY